jgi:hypothetical protein
VAGNLQIKKTGGAIAAPPVVVSCGMLPQNETLMSRVELSSPWP